MSSPFLVLHLSDSHFGSPRHGDDARRVLAPVLADLHAMAEKLGVPDLVVFSGDLAFGSTHDSSLTQQFDLARSWIKEVHSAVGTELGEVPQLIVPGNHDLDRGLRDRPQLDWLNGLESEDAVYELMCDPRSITWRNLVAAQAVWHEFVTSLPSGPWIIDDDFLLTTGFIQHGSQKIGVAGLNTCWSCSANDGQGKLWLGRAQLQRADTRLADGTFKIAVSHHPPSWLREGESSLVEERLEAGYQVYLHGHVHSQWVSDRFRHLRVSAGPCYAGSEKTNAYSWLQIDFDEAQALVHLRTYSDKGTGGWVPYPVPGVTDDEGVTVARGLFAEPARRAPVAESAGAAAVLVSGAAPLGQVVIPPLFSDLEGISAGLAMLESHFSLRFEPFTFNSRNSPVLVYWPIRLRPPTPIHAVQCFVAGALQRLGATVALCLDDLGNAPTTPARFRERADSWMSRVGGRAGEVRLSIFSELLGEDFNSNLWTTHRKWLTNPPGQLMDAFRIAKILPDGGAEVSLDELLRGRPRRLLTPALVWTSLYALHLQFPDHRILTLGGLDEMDLWKTWRELDFPPVPAGHLYVPQLLDIPPGNSASVLHMSERDLAWDSRGDISRALATELEGELVGADWCSVNRLPGWCLQECVRLPAWLAAGEGFVMVGDALVSHLSHLAQLPSPRQLVEPLTQAVAQWLF